MGADVKKNVHAREEDGGESRTSMSQFEYANSHSSGADDVLRFQATAGNSAVSQLLSIMAPTYTGPSTTIGVTNSASECEAARFAESVGAIGGDQTGGHLDEIEENLSGQRHSRLPDIPPTQRPRPIGGLVVKPGLNAAIQRARGGGRPLSKDVRTSMEGHLTADFRDTRIHTNDMADRLTRALGARAFTLGHDVFFRQSAYAPASPVGGQLLAHELTHVAQQATYDAGGIIQRDAEDDAQGVLDDSAWQEEMVTVSRLRQIFGHIENHVRSVREAEEIMHFIRNDENHDLYMAFRQVVPECMQDDLLDTLVESVHRMASSQGAAPSPPRPAAPVTTEHRQRRLAPASTVAREVPPRETAPPLSEAARRAAGRMPESPRRAGVPVWNVPPRTEEEAEGSEALEERLATLERQAELSTTLIRRATGVRRESAAGALRRLNIALTEWETQTVVDSTSWLAIFDDDGALIGYYRESNGYEEIRDRLGDWRWSDEPGLTRPLIDPIDIATMFIGIGTIRFALRVTGRVLSRLLTRRASAGVARRVLSSLREVARRVSTRTVSEGAAARGTGRGLAVGRGLLGPRFFPHVPEREVLIEQAWRILRGPGVPPRHISAALPRQHLGRWRLLANGMEQIEIAARPFTLGRLTGTVFHEVAHSVLYRRFPLLTRRYATHINEIISYAIGGYGRLRGGFNMLDRLAGLVEIVGSPWAAYGSVRGLSRLPLYVRDAILFSTLLRWYVNWVTENREQIRRFLSLEEEPTQEEESSETP